MIVCYVIRYALQLIMYLGRSNPWRTSGGEFIPELTLQSYEQAFEIEYTHNSTAIEGNTLTLIETKVLLEDRITIGGKQLREIYETVNHQKAYRYVKQCIAENQPLNEKNCEEYPCIVDGKYFYRRHLPERGCVDLRCTRANGP